MCLKLQKLFARINKDQFIKLFSISDRMVGLFILSLVNAINPEQNFEEFCIGIVFNQSFNSNSWNPNKLLRQKSI